MYRAVILSVALVFLAVGPASAQRGLQPIFADTPTQAKDISGSTCTTSDTYAPSGTTTMCWTVYNNGFVEYLDVIELVFPAGWTVQCNTQDAQDSGGSNVDMDCTASANTVTYSDSNGGAGEIWDGATWGFCVDVTAGADAPPQTVTYNLSGDDFGDPPHDISDTESIVPVELMSFSVE